MQLLSEGSVQSLVGYPATISVANFNLIKEQECILVGCVPPMAVAIHGRAGGLPQCILGCTPWVWAWRPPQVWAWRPPWPDPSTSPLGVDLETPCCKACWDTTCNACWDTTPLLQGMLGYHLQCMLGIPPSPCEQND